MTSNIYLFSILFRLISALWYLAGSCCPTSFSRSLCCPAPHFISTSPAPQVAWSPRPANAKWKNCRPTQTKRRRRRISTTASSACTTRESRTNLPPPSQPPWRWPTSMIYRNRITVADGGKYPTRTHTPPTRVVASISRKNSNHVTFYVLVCIYTTYPRAGSPSRRQQLIRMMIPCSHRSQCMFVC